MPLAVAEAARRKRRRYRKKTVPESPRRWRRWRHQRRRGMGTVVTGPARRWGSCGLLVSGEWGTHMRIYNFFSF
jgi:hypothetical protein